MKKVGLALITAAVLAACNVTVVTPGPPPGTSVAVDGAGVTKKIAPSAHHCFELTVGEEPVRIDVKHDEAADNGELYVEVFDEDNQPYAHTDNRDFFAKAGASLASLSVGAQDINVTLPYSVNIPKNMGKVYVEVTNKTAVDATVTVKAVTRNEVPRDDAALSGPPASGLETSKIYGGALLFLGQEDTYVYTGPDGYTLKFDVPPGDFVHAQLILNDNTTDPITPGTSGIGLLNGDTFKVASQGLERAGFCSTTVDPACTDGIDTGEYSITISR